MVCHDEEIKSQILQHSVSTKRRRKALNDTEITLQQLLDYGKTIELTETQLAAIENQKQEGKEMVNNLRKHVKSGRKKRNGSGQPRRERQSGGTSRTRPNNTTCRHGGKTACLANKKECRNCGKLGHFKAVCRSESKMQHTSLGPKTVRVLDKNYSSDSDSDKTAFRLTLHNVSQE